MRRSLLFLPFLAVTAQPAGFGEAEVTHLAFGPDGKALTGAYFRHAINRPGTDWGAFGVTWDVATGRATTLPNVIGPVAYSPDGKVLATGLVERGRGPGFRSRPYVQLALWTPGKAGPDAVVTAPTDPGPTAAGREADKGTVVAFAFHPGGKDLAVASTDQLWWHPLGGKARPVADLLLARSWWGDAHRLTFDDGGKVLRLTGPVGDGRRTASVTWKVEKGDAGATFTEVGREEALRELTGKVVVTAVSPDGVTKATAAGMGVTLADAKTGKVVRVLQPGK
jgi:hypothetical protein